MVYVHMRPNFSTLSLLVRVFDLNLCLAHRMLLPPWTQRICRQSRPQRDITIVGCANTKRERPGIFGLLKVVTSILRLPATLPFHYRPQASPKVKSHSILQMSRNRPNVMFWVLRRDIFSRTVQHGHSTTVTNLPAALGYLMFQTSNSRSSL